MTPQLLLRIALVVVCASLPGAAAAQASRAGHAQQFAGPGGTKPDPQRQRHTSTPQDRKPQPAKPDASNKPGAGEQPPAEDHSAHMAQAGQPSDAPKEPIPPLTDADRAAAFPPELDGHPAHDRGITSFVLIDQLEWQGAGDGGGSWDTRAWVGGDLNRVWVRAEGESEDGRIENALVDVLYGRSVSRWWDLVAGVRRDFKPGPGRTWVGAGIQGLAPYWFELEATGYVGEGGRTHARFEVEYELLLTNRLILQPLIEGEIYGKADELRGIGAGLSTLEGGLRLRYEFKREFAPYVGLTWNRRFFGTADLARARGDDTGATRVAFGLRTWF